jgi:hypothetical protein
VHCVRANQVRALGGDHQLLTACVKTRSIARLGSHVRPLFAALIVGLVALAVHVPETAAKAPPLATTVLDVNALAAPDYSAAVVAVFPADAEVELTGNASPGFLGVVYDGREVFVPAQYLSLGTRPGIDTATTVADAPMLDAPMRDGNVLTIVPEGQTVLITGATVDGYDAASYDGTGGWMNGRDLAR